LKFISTVRLDVSDENVFPFAAQAGEWALTGTFVFSDAEPEVLSKKEQLAFRNGWLGTNSFGRSTFVLIKEITDEQYELVVSRLAKYIFELYGAPNMNVATKAAHSEAAFAAGLCEHPIGTMLSIERAFTDDGISERFHLIQSQDNDMHAKIWSIVED